jgi:hypothetical protein
MLPNLHAIPPARKNTNFPHIIYYYKSPIKSSRFTKVNFLTFVFGDLRPKTTVGFCATFRKVKNRQRENAPPSSVRERFVILEHNGSAYQLGQKNRRGCRCGYRQKRLVKIGKYNSHNGSDYG